MPHARPEMMTTDPLAGHRVLGFDLETTGLSASQHRIVQYALIGCDADGTPMQLEALVNPRRAIPPETTRVHGITDADVRGLPDFKSHVAAIAEAIEGAVIVGHNVERFDWPFLRNEFTRAGVAMPRPLAILDTLRIARKLRLPPRHKLGVLCQRFDISLENAHTAGADAAATLLLLHRMMAAHPQHFRRPVEDIPDWLSATRTSDRGADRLGPGLADLEPVPGSHGWLCHTETDVVIVRGRNRGRSIAEIDRDDASYLDWLASPAGPLEAEAVEVLTAQRA